MRDHMKFTLDIDPPRATAQEKGVRVINGKPWFFKKPHIQKIEADYKRALFPFIPEHPITGAICMKVSFHWHMQTYKQEMLKPTKPDTENALKLLKDCMTDLGFWKDDAQVCVETVTKWGTPDKGRIDIEMWGID